MTFKQLILFDIVIGETSIRTDAFDYDLSAAIVDDYCVLSAQLKTCLSLSITYPNLYEFVKCALMFSASEGRFNHRSTVFSPLKLTVVSDIYLLCKLYFFLFEKSIKNPPISVDNIGISIRIYFDSLASKWFFFIEWEQNNLALYFLFIFYVCTVVLVVVKILFYERSSMYEWHVTMPLCILGTDWFLGNRHQG